MTSDGDSTTTLLNFSTAKNAKFAKVVYDGAC